jgi:hypothetical protein
VHPQQATAPPSDSRRLSLWVACHVETTRLTLHSPGMLCCQQCCIHAAACVAPRVAAVWPHLRRSVCSRVSAEKREKQPSRDSSKTCKRYAGGHRPNAASDVLVEARGKAPWALHA